MKSLSFNLLACLFLSITCVHAQEKTLAKGSAEENKIAGGQRQAYRLLLEEGQYAQVSVEQISVDLVIDVLDPEGEKIDEVDQSYIGDVEYVKIAAGDSGAYRLEVYPFVGELSSESSGGAYKIQIEELLSRLEYEDRLKVDREKHQAAIEWLKNNAIPLKGVAAEQGFEDMQPLKQLIGDARLVSLGEATHGTREFFQAKHRMLEFLVTEMGFNIFAIEATMPESFDVNEYVLTGEGDPEKALAGLYFWTWNTEEVLEMIRWMRRYNVDPSHTRKVKFYGFDMQPSTRPLKVLIDFLNETGSEYAGRITGHPALSLLIDPYTATEFAYLDEEPMRDALLLVDSAIQDLEANREKYVDRTNEKDWGIARLHADVVTQNIKFNMPTDDFMRRVVVRDSSMAANARWILEHEDPGSKMVIWAHNGHVATQPIWMGQHLRDVYGDDMVVFGFAFNQGSFQAMELPFSGGVGLRPFHVSPLQEESLDATLAAAGLPYAVVDLHAIPDEGYVADWFAEPRETRSIGSGFTLESPGFTQPQRVADRYDALFFVDETTAARPNPGGTRSRLRTLQRPENLDFESNTPGQIPEGWNANKYGLSNFDFTVETSSEAPQQGERCLKIFRGPGKHYGETFGSLSQRLEAEAYRGKRIKLRAAVRTEVEGAGNHAYLWLNVTKEGIGPQSRLFFDRMADRPITTPDWQFFEIAGDVPEDAEWIGFGMALSGEGSAWFDSFSIETIAP